jgi:hypothetical protein
MGDVLGEEIWAMEQYALKNVQNVLNTNISSYLETSGACVIKLFTVVIDYRGN